MTKIVQAPNIQYIIEHRKTIFEPLVDELRKNDEIIYTPNFPAFVCLSMAISEALIDITASTASTRDFELFRLSESLYGMRFSGKELINYDLSHLTKSPDESRTLLFLCKYDTLYTPMYPNYLITDADDIKQYFCENKNKVTTIETMEDLHGINVTHKSYTITPDEKLRIYTGNHSQGSCGQPVICAGEIDVVEGKIKSINNVSGHYRPNEDALIQARNFLLEKKLIEDNNTVEKKGIHSYLTMV